MLVEITIAIAVAAIAIAVFFAPSHHPLSVGRCRSYSTWPTGWYSGCGGGAWTPITFPFRTWRHSGTCWGPGCWPSASTSCGWLGTATQTWGTEKPHTSTLPLPAPPPQPPRPATHPPTSSLSGRAPAFSHAPPLLIPTCWTVPISALLPQRNPTLSWKRRKINCCLRKGLLVILQWGSPSSLAKRCRPLM